MSRNGTSNDNGSLNRSKPPKPFYQKWWVWLVIGLAVIVIIMIFTGKEDVAEEPDEPEVIEQQEEQNEPDTEEEPVPEDEEETEVTPEDEEEITEDDETIVENEVDPFNDLPIETQFVVINSMMDNRILGWEDESSISQAFMSFVTYYEDVHRFSYQVHSGAGTGHPEYHWTIYDDRVTFEVGYVGSGAGKLIKLFPENEEEATIQKSDLYEVYVQFQNRFEIWADEVDMEFASESDENSESRFDEFQGETSTETVEVPSTDIQDLLND